MTDTQSATDLPCVPTTADATAAAGSSGGAFVVPPANRELRKEEEARMLGADLMVNLLLPNGTKEHLQVKTASEVGYVKALLVQKLKLPPRDSFRVTLLLDGNPMLDPMSMCDHPNVTPPEVNVEVRIADPK